MSKVIRTGQVAAGSGVVTLGRAEAGLFYDPEAEAGSQQAPRIDLNVMIEARLADVRRELDQQWESRLRQEHDTTRAAGERQLSAAQQQHREQVERLRRERYEEGYDAGVAAKEAEAREAVERMAALHDSMKAERAQVLLDAEMAVVDLALALARRVVQVETSADRRIVARTAREALHHLSQRSHLLLKVHPDDLGVARRFVAAWVKRVDADAILRVLTSGHVDRGGCMIEGPEENVDARLTSQLEVLHAALRDQMLHRHAAGDAPAAPGEEGKAGEDEGVAPAGGDG